MNEKQRAKVEYDGNTIRLIVPDEEALLKKLQERQQEIVNEIESELVKEIESENQRVAIDKKMEELAEKLGYIVKDNTGKIVTMHNEYIGLKNGFAAAIEMQSAEIAQLQDKILLHEETKEKLLDDIEYQKKEIAQLQHELEIEREGNEAFFNEAVERNKKLAASQEQVQVLREALQYAKGQLIHAGYTKNAVPAIEKALAEVEKLK